MTTPNAHAAVSVSIQREHGAPELRFDHVWLARTERVKIDCADGVTFHRVFDPATRTWWFARSAYLAATGGCDQLQREIELADRLQPSWAAVPVATVLIAEQMFLVFPGSGTSTVLSTLVNGTMPIAAFLGLAVGATRAVAEAHANGVLHGDIRPQNFLVDGEEALRLTGFGHASVFDAKSSVLRQPAATAQPYLSPEMARRDPSRVSAKADLYSLGITLYELLTASRPFEAESPAAWQHAHVAIEPAPVQTRRPDVPAILADIILKLMAKDVKDRYTSAASVLSDLLRCRREWSTHAAIAPFPLDVKGFAPALNISGQLFGRKREMETLGAALARVSARGKSELVLLAGGAGTGKSALVEWLAREASQQGLRFAGGKSDQLQLDIPFASISQAIRSMTMTLLGEDEPSVARVRERWISQLEGQGKAIAELVPEVEHIIGATIPLSNVPAGQAQARAERAILRTLSAFAQDGQPLVVFIDDLQWADASTIGLLKAFATRPPDNVLLLGAYRDQSAQLVEQLDSFLDASHSGTVPVTHIQVGPLAVGELGELIGSALSESSSHISTLARAIYARTGGNPFFSYQLLRTLVDDGILSYDIESSRWHWSETEVTSWRYSDNVIDLMLRRFARLPAAGSELLQQLACIGIRCEEGLLARIAQAVVPAIRQQLSPFVEAGLLIREHDGYAFQHDRVLESAYSIIDPEVRPRTHARIASVMIEYWPEQLAEHAFEICNQIERASGHALTEDERVAFVRVQIVAGKRARSAAALAQAASYINAAFDLMEPSWWSSHYALAYAATLSRCECLLAQADLANASSEIDDLLRRHLPAIDKAAVHRLKAILQTVRSDYEGAITAALSGLALLDVNLQRGPTRAQLRASYDTVRAALQGRSIASLGTLPATDDHRIQTVMGLLSTLISSLFVTDGISFLHVAKMVELTLDHGVTAESPYGLSWFGVFIASLYGEYEDGLAYGLAALTIVNRHGYESERIATLVALDQVSAWTRPLSYALGHAQKARKLGRASGDIGMACYACNHIASDLLVMGEHLQLVEEEIERGLELTRLVQYQDIELILYSQRHFTLRLRSGDALPPHGEHGDKHAAIASSVTTRIAQSNSQPTLFWIWLYDGMAALFLQDFEHALASLQHAAELTWSAPAHINVADCHLFIALAMSHSESAATDLESVVTVLSAHRERFDRWAALNALTFRNKLLLIDAELARLRGDYFEALLSYEQSADAAAAAGFVHEQALAHEFAGMMCEATGLHSSGRQHLRTAHACYRRWGADHKAGLLAIRYPDLVAMQHNTRSITEKSGSGATINWELGINAAQAMSGEVVMDRLIETLMTNVIVHVGAQYGVLLLIRDEGPTIEASARVSQGKVAVTIGTVAPTEQALPLTVLNSVVRTQATLVLADAMVDAPSLLTHERHGGSLRSVLCQPLVRGGALIGIFYLENNLAPGVFDSSRVADLAVLAPQVAISLETARLYEELINENNRRVSAEMSLRAARAELAQTSHLTVMGSLAASIAHEVNQPLTAIGASVNACLRWLNRPTPDLTEVQAGLSHIKQTSERAEEIIRALRSLARQTPSLRAPLRPDDVIHDVLNMLRMEIDEQRVTVTTRLEAGTATVEADRVQLQQVVLNLITNALEAMAQTPPERRELILTSSHQQHEIVVGVQDNGSGIPDDMLVRVFDPFFTTKQAGMGMGLAICRSIIEAHGGSLEVHPHNPGGCELEFRLPVSDFSIVR
ncbi:AAA family ATPase [Paraburkholderia sp. CNPSo 3157]|uniref:histidine kinase n=1 Tax=Paraburkholderia franconis TaxID=2654983 RepID=A0A7X1NJK7_9BURK|nr:AAA family ATPase [Paraburkholderia franconis]MPW23140.1 AAA family ATPase [Paraburkholderia franconis]